MKNKLFLYSMHVNEQQLQELDRLTGKTDRSEMRIAAIVHATDVFPDAGDWVPGVLDSLRAHGYTVQIKDLNRSTDFDDCDIIWICGGHTYYLRYILKKTGADDAIVRAVAQGKVFAGWSAGAVVAGPTTQFFHLMGDDPEQAPEVVDDGLQLTEYVVVPHYNNPAYRESALLTEERLRASGFKTIPLNDDQVVVIDGYDSMHIV